MAYMYIPIDIKQFCNLLKVEKKASVNITQNSAVSSSGEGYRGWYSGDTWLGGVAENRPVSTALSK